MKHSTGEKNPKTLQSPWGNLWIQLRTPVEVLTLLQHKMS